MHQLKWTYGLLIICNIILYLLILSHIFVCFNAELFISEEKKSSMIELSISNSSWYCSRQLRVSAPVDWHLCRIVHFVTHVMLTCNVCNMYRTTGRVEGQGRLSPTPGVNIVLKSWEWNWPVCGEKVNIFNFPTANYQNSQYSVVFCFKWLFYKRAEYSPLLRPCGARGAPSHVTGALRRNQPPGTQQSGRSPRPHM